VHFEVCLPILGFRYGTAKVGRLAREDLGCLIQDRLVLAKILPNEDFG
jgi:hypothetical protein